ncbi:MAG: hypothetical protein N7Q72_04695 [Spiroplasma sp. Tabriz.8]|nr:hypothetical protein [Spiroplasma sp. Tabriz.8]
MYRHVHKYVSSNLWTYIYIYIYIYKFILLQIVYFIRDGFKFL